MDSKTIFDRFRKTCDDLNIPLFEKDDIIFFKQRKSSSEGTHRFEGYFSIPQINQK